MPPTSQQQRATARPTVSDTSFDSLPRTSEGAARRRREGWFCSVPAFRLPAIGPAIARKSLSEKVVLLGWVTRGARSNSGGRAFAALGSQARHSPRRSRPLRKVGALAEPAGPHVTALIYFADDF